MNIPIDKLLYPIMMQIRSLRTFFRADDDNNKIVLDCQNKVESLVLSIIHFVLDLVIEGPNHTTLSFNKSTFDLKKEFQNKMDCIQQHIQNSDPEALRRNILQFYEVKEGFSESDSEDESASMQIKLTGRLKEFNPEIQTLRQELEQKDQLIEQYRQKLKYRQNSLEVMAHNHHKEVSQLKVQQAFNHDGSLFEIKYFDSTQMLEPDVIAMMNEKIEDIKNQYEKYVQQYIEKFQRQRPPPLPKEFNLSEFSVQELLKAALQKEDNPYVIFKMIQDIKSISFITTVLVHQQSKYGIDYAQLNHAMRANNQDLQKLINARIVMEDCSSQISAQYLLELEKKKQEIFELNQQIAGQEVNFIQQLAELQKVIENSDNSSKLNEVILNQQRKIDQLKNENYNINTTLLNVKQHNLQKSQQHSFLMNNLKHLFDIIYNKSKGTMNIDKTDFVKDRSAIIKDILSKVNHLEGYETQALAQELQLLLYQTDSMHIVKQITNGLQQSKQTQTIQSKQEHQSFEEKKQPVKKEQKMILQHLENLKQEKIKENQHKNISTQTENLEQQLSCQNVSQDLETIASNNQYINSSSVNMLLLKQQQFIKPFKKFNQSRDATPEPSFEKQYSVFDKLYTQQKHSNPRWMMLKPLIEKLSEEEFQEVVNTLGLYSFRQQQITQNSALDVPQYDISRIQQSQVYKTLKQKIRDKSEEQTANVFVELVEHREQAIKQFEQQRIDTYRRRIQRLLPAQPTQCLMVEQKLRPRSKTRCCSVQKT